MSTIRPHAAAASYAVRVIRLCASCGARYAAASLCDACLRDADTDVCRKRAIMFPADFAELC